MMDRSRGGGECRPCDPGGSSGEEWTRNELSGRAETVVQARDIAELHVSTAPRPPEVVPRQLPPLPPVFVNRESELAVLRELVGGPPGGPVGSYQGEAADVGSPAVVMLTGLPGVGKSAVGRRWAHEVRDRFDGGQLYADLGPLRSRGGVAVGDVVAGFLRAFGVHSDWIPGELAERVALFRSVTAGRRLLILLDDVDQPAQVTSLLPASGGSMVVVTTPRYLEELAADGAVAVPLAPLDTHAGVRLLGALCGAERIEAEPQAAAAVVELCGGLPVALRVVGARLARRRWLTLGRLCEELESSSGPGAVPDAEGRLVVRAVFDAAYGDLPAEAARMYRRLAAHPGRELPLGAAAAAAGVASRVAVALLADLVDAHLVEELGAARYRLHDVVARDVDDRATADPAGEQEAARRRVVEWYLRAAAGADRLVMGDRLRLDAGEPAAGPPVEPVGFATPAEALEWLEREGANLREVVRLAAAHGWDPQVVLLADALWALYVNRRPYRDWIVVAGLGVEAARRSGDRRAEARLRSLLARGLLDGGEVERADQEMAGAAAALRDAAGADEPDVRLEASVLEFTGLVRLAQDRLDEAAEVFERARELNDRAGRPRGVAFQLGFLGRVRMRQGRPEQALARFEEARALMAAAGDERGAARTGIESAEAYLALGRDREAVAAAEAAGEVMRRRGVPFYEAKALEVLTAAVARAGGDGLEGYLQRLLDLYVAAANPRAEAVREQLTALRAGPGRKDPRTGPQPCDHQRPAPDRP